MAKNRRDLTTVVTWCKRTCPKLKTPCSSSYNAQPLYLAHLDTRTIKGEALFLATSLGDLIWDLGFLETSYAAYACRV